MIINSVLSGGNTRQDIQLSTSNIFLIRDSGEEAILLFSYTHLENKKGFVVLYLDGNVLTSFEIETNGDYTIDINDYLLEMEFYQFKLIVIDENKSIDSLEFKVLYAFDNIDDMSFVYDPTLSGYVASIYTGPATFVNIPPMMSGQNGEHPVVKIGEGAFFNNDIIETVIIPSSVQSIGATAFYSCSNLKNVTVNSLTPPILAGDPGSLITNVFNPYNELSLLKIYVPAVSLDLYKNAQYWKQYENDIYPIE
jgi:hypothetical protein